MNYKDAMAHFGVPEIAKQIAAQDGLPRSALKPMRNAATVPKPRPAGSPPGQGLKSTRNPLTVPKPMPLGQYNGPRTKKLP